MRIWAYVILAGIIFGGITAGARWAWQSGYDSRDREEAALWEDVVANAEAQVIVEERIVTEIREIEKEVPRVVERIVEVMPECSDLGPDFISVLNNQVRAANQVQDAEGPVAMATGVP